jgi:non-specific serine/threonine protein kinase
MLQIYLFGQPHLVVNGKLVSKKPFEFAASPKTHALLVYLLLHRDEPLARTTVAFTLWSDLTETDARAHLRRHLHELRRALPSAPKSKPWILADAQTVQWNPEADSWLDLAAFQDALADPARLADALNLYTADIAANLDEDWLLFERERVRELYMTGLEQLASAYESAGDYRQGIRTAQRLLREDPLREDTYRRLMRLHALGGDRSGVVRVFNTCRTVLARELQIEPSAETRREFSRLVALEVVSEQASRPQQGASPVHNLPLYLDRFVGRAHELEELEHILFPGMPPLARQAVKVRLLTLVGLGGTGKTRLAAALAAKLAGQFADGAWWIDLAPLGEPSQLAQSVAAALGLRDQATPQVLTALLNHLRDKQVLLILDNCEHLSEPVAQLAEEILRLAPHVCILATSAEPLGVSGEVLYPVRPLAVPAPQDASAAPGLLDPSLAECESVLLFTERATLALPTFYLDAQNVGVVAHICRALDGIPLALELAAARLKVLTVAQLAARLDDRFTLLTGTSRTTLPRHQTLRATMDWSYGLLSDAEKILFQRLAVFPGGFTLESAETVSAGGLIPREHVLDLLSQLVDKSLVVVAERGQGGVARYRQLETVRQYARDRLADSGEMETLRRAHLAFFVKLVAEGEPHLLRSAEQMAWLDRLDVEYDNLRGALRWAHALDDIESLARLAGGMWAFWWLRGFVNEGRRWLGVALSQPERLAPALYSKCLEGAGRLATLQGDHLRARGWLEQQVELERARGDVEGTATALNSLAIVVLNLGDYDRAAALWQESRVHYELRGNLWGVARVLNNLGDLALYRGDYAQALADFDSSLVLFRELGETFGSSIALINLGRAALLSGDPERARDYFSESLVMKRALADKEGMAWTLEGLAGVAAAQALPVRAAQLFGAAHAVRASIGVPVPPSDSEFFENSVARARGQLDAGTWESAWAQGEALSLESALALALETAPFLQPDVQRSA